ncbi:glycosyltransferase family 2 protein [Candidatus Saccharibacteria bacterium]|nr:glycosyltransferase family 2 protein [Candidatus Saccharibacteria bacterium]
MNVKELEIPLDSEKTKRYRFFEILPGALSWSILAFPFVMSEINAAVTALFILAFFLMWFARAVGLNIRVLQGWHRLQKYQRYDWSVFIDELEAMEIPDRSSAPKWHVDNIRRLQETPALLKPSEVIHAIIIPTHTDGRAILEPTIKYIIDSKFDIKKTIFVLTYEERAGEHIEKECKDLVKEYGKYFRHAIATKHPKDLLNEVKGKGPNGNWGCRRLKEYLDEENIDPKQVIVTMFDADNRPHPNYFGVLTYMVASTINPVRASYQPVPIYTNNIWDAPALMRVIATGNSFWNVVISMRPHMIRNFASHAQSMQGLIETDYLSARTVVEDGHQFWRSYFAFEGKYDVYPMYVSVFQDAVLAPTYRKTIKEQFIQLRRWAYGASDVAYVAEKGFFTKNKISKVDVTFKFLRLLEGHVSWATAPLILALAAFIPLLFNPDDYVANQLPILVSRIQTVAMIGIFITLFLSFKVLPPKPKRYKAHRNIFMVLQWVLLPITTIVFSSFAALNSQTRLIFKRYLNTFDATIKHVKTDND